MAENEIREPQISYIKHTKTDIMFKRITLIFLFVYIVLPQYFGINTPGFDLTAQRIAVLVLFFIVLENKRKSKLFFQLIRNFELLPYICIYMFVCLYTAVFRHHIGSFAYPLIEFLAMFLLIFYVNEYLEFDSIINIICIFSFCLSVLGIIEYGTHHTPFLYLETIKGLFSGGGMRSGSYRVVGPANHPLGYGLMLIIFIPIACLNSKKDKVDILYRPFLLLLLILNVFLTGSRSTLAVAILELFFLFLFQGRNCKKKSIVYILIFFVLFSIFLMISYKTSFSRYILRQFTSVIDEIFKTNYAVNFGANATVLSNSSEYRKYLPKIFTESFLNPLIGRGSGYTFRWYVDGFYIESIDNFYVALFIRYAYPGMITYILIIIRALISLVRTIFYAHSGTCKVLLCSLLCYFINLWWLDTLQTIKYAYIVIALFYIYVSKMQKK